MRNLFIQNFIVGSIRNTVKARKSNHCFVNLKIISKNIIKTRWRQELKNLWYWMKGELDCLLRKQKINQTIKTNKQKQIKFSFFYLQDFSTENNSTIYFKESLLKKWWNSCSWENYSSIRSLFRGRLRNGLLLLFSIAFTMTFSQNF